MEFSGVYNRDDTVFRDMNSRKLWIVSFAGEATIRGGLFFSFLRTLN
jgi:hypothetical protein